VDKDSIVKLVLIGAAGYLAYNWLQSSGLWAQWFGGNNFSTAASLLQYCQQNPNGTASFNGQSAPCSAWLKAAQPTAPPATTSSSTTPTPAAGPVSTPVIQARVTPLTVQSLLNAVAQQGTAATASTTFNSDQWNYFVTTYIDHNALVDVDLTPLGYVQGSPLTAQQYISLRQQAGISGLGFARTGTAYSNPYKWRM
jgi:hypothetical protein